MKFSKEKLIIFVILVTEVLGFSLILPYLPFYAQKFGANAFQIGLISTVFSLFQFVSAPIMGSLSDKYGRRPFLIFSQLSTFLSFVILALANCLPLIYLSRIVDGLLGSNYTIAQAYLADISSKKDRSKAFGISGVAFGFGFLIGPAIGGWLSQFGFSLPAFISAGISLATIMTTYFFLPETVKKDSEKKIDLKILDLDNFKRYFQNPAINTRLWQFFFYILAQVTWSSNFTLYAQRQLNIQPQQIGFFLAYIGLVSIVFRGILLGKLINWLGEKRLEVIGGLLMLMAFLGVIFIRSPYLFLLIGTFLSMGNGLLRPILVGTVSQSAPRQHQGAVMGVLNSLGSVAQISGPLIGGTILNYLSPGTLGVLSCLLISFSLLLNFKETAIS